MRRLALLTIVTLLAFIFGGPVTLAGSGDEDKAGDALHFVELDPVTVPILRGRGRPMMVVVDLTLEMVDAEAATKARAMAPRLRDACVTALYGEAGKGRILVDGLVNLPRVRDAMEVALQERLGEDMLKAVLVQNVNQQ